MSQEDRLSRLSPEKRALLALRLPKRRGASAAAVKEHFAVIPDPAARQEPFPLTDTQQAYWIGRTGVFDLGRVAAHFYFEIDARGLDLDRLERAFRALIARHGMLRVVFLEDGRQRVLEEVPPYRIESLDLRGKEPGAVASGLEAIRARMSHQVLPSDRWPLFEVRASRIDEARTRLHLSFDGLALDGWSMFLLFDEWRQLYQDPHKILTPLELEFRDYVLAEGALQESESYRASLEYWRGRLPEFPAPPDLPLAKSPSAVIDPSVVRRTSRLEPEDWARLKTRATQLGLTPASVLVAAYAEVVSLWSTNPRFTLNVPRFNRSPLHPQVNDILGEFASFTLLEVDTGRDDRFEERARRLQERQWEDLDHGEVSGVRIARELAQIRGSSSGGVMPVVFTNAPMNSQGDEVSLLSTTKDLGEVVFSLNQTPQVWLDNHVSERGGALVCEWDTVEELFPPGLSQDMFEAFGRFLEKLAREDEPWRWKGPEIAHALLPPGQERLRTGMPSAAVPVPDCLIQDLFLEQAKRQPDAPAVLAPDRTLTYAELDRLSSRWARRLARVGAVPNSLVAVVMEKGWEQIVAALAILRSGAAYLPIDSAVPAERLAFLLENGGARLVLTQSRLDQRLAWPAGLQRFSVDVDAEEPDAASTPAGTPSTPDDLAYVIYTSGSTGLPKGVMIAHRGVVNSIVCTNARFGVHAGDRVLGLTALHHDMSVYDIFGVLAAGGTLVLPSPEGVRDPLHWSERMRAHGVTIWNSVPAMMEMLLEYAEGRTGVTLPKLRLAFLGGDWIPITIPGRLGSVSPDARIVSVGGPTETTLWNIWYPVERMDPSWTSIPYGRPIANTRYYVMSESLQDRPDWVAGEMYCAGVGLAKGYWRDEERTREKFFTHPRTGERLYRTGDLGRFRSDGNLEFVGRADLQVKIAGQRIELGEIESALRTHPSVREAVVSALGAAQEKKRLVAYVVPREAAGATPEELREFLGKKLAPHMIPSAFVALDRLPLTRNGKVDRKALPEPASAAPAPRSGTSLILGRIARAIEQILRIERIADDANLLALGANSIDMIRIGNFLEQEFGSRPRMDELFRLQTPAALAGYYEDRKAASPAGRASPGDVPGPTADVDALIARYRVLLDPAERDAFKDRQAGIRPAEGRRTIALPREALDERMLSKYSERRSHRSFSLKPIPAADFGRFLGGLSQATVEGARKYRYASPGGLYPGQVYLHVKPGRIADVAAGTYYYHPIDHALVSLTPDVEIDRDIHIPFINIPIFDEAAFSIFLIAQMSAIAPFYGEKALHFATLEAGIIAHHLESVAPEFQIGLCQIGGLEFDRIRHLFRLEESHVLIHSLLGGRIDGVSVSRVSAPGEPDEASRAANILKRVRELSKEEIQALLDANRKLDSGEEPQ